jgi:hypothetical protein
MASETPSKAFTRRALLAGAVATGASAGTALAAGRLGDPSDGDLGQVISIDDGFATVSLDKAGQTARARAQGGHRGLRVGDRVVVGEHDGELLSARPLYLSVDGVIERVASGGLRVAGFEYQTDKHSVVRAHDSIATPISPSRGGLRPGVRVGLLCLQNPLERTRLVDTIYVLERA